MIDFYRRERLHIIFALIFSLLLITFFSVFIYFITKNSWGYFLYFLPSFIITFASLKILRSIFLLINLNTMERNFADDRMNIYIYESWHKKIVGNFWIWIMFQIMFVYSWVLYLFFSFFQFEAIANILLWKFTLIIVLFSVASFVIYKSNYFILSRYIKFSANNIEGIEDNVNELRLMSISVKNDYKNLVLIVVGIFSIIPFILMLFPSFRNFYKRI